MTQKLYESAPECYEFEATVLSCAPREDGTYDVVLDRTAFFPEGGGQGADHGTLGGATVRDAQEQGGVVHHVTNAPVQTGTRVRGAVDAVRRLEMSRQHTGEHIFSGIVHSRYGYDNVGFHIGTQAVTMDFSGPLTWEDALLVQRLANEAIWADLPVEAFVADPQTLANLAYRSKKEIKGDVRIVRIEGIDTCACCGTHVRTTGHIGQVKVLDVQRYKGGTRVSILCGGRALEEEDALLAQIRAASETLNASRHEIAQAAQRLVQERDALRAKNGELGMRIFELLARQAESEPVRVVACDALPPSQAGKAAGGLCEGAICALVLIPCEEGGWRFALASRTQSVRPLAAALFAAFGGRGGGPQDLAQGVLNGGTREQIEKKLRSLI